MRTRARGLAVVAATMVALIAGVSAPGAVAQLPEGSRQSAPVVAEPARPMAQQPARPAAPARISGTPLQFSKQIAAVEPIRAGYKGTSSFLPPSVAKGKDKQGCNLRQQMLLKSAYVKPKVGKGCALKGGVWYTDGGTKRVTKSKDVLFVPTMSLGEAWGQGASQWTPAQRLAWATQVDRPGPQKTRAKAAINLQATQQLVSSADADRATILLLRRLGAENGVEKFNRYCNKGLLTLLAMTFDPFLISICGPDNLPYIEQYAQERRDDVDAFCRAQEAIISNVRAWGLSLPESQLAQYSEISLTCPNLNAVRELTLDSSIHGIIPIPPPTSVTTEYGDIAVTREDVFTLPLSATPNQPGTQTATASSFGIAAPVDWGEPGVKAGYLRLWDAGVSWRQMQPDGDKPIDWSKLDATIAMAKRIGAKVMYVLGDTPGWANGGKSGATPPTDLTEASEFIREICSRYKGAIASYEVWNEGNLTTFWTGSMDQLADLTKLVKTAVGACGSGAKVYASSTGTRATNAFATNYPAYLQALAKRDWPVDGYTVHSYPAASGGPQQRAEEIAQFKTLLAQNGAPGRDVLDTELNYGLAGLGENHRDIDPAMGAAYISQSFIQSVQYGIDTTFWFLWTQGYYDKLGIQLHPGTQQTIDAWNQTRSWLVGRAMSQCASGLEVNACQLVGSPNMTLIWTNGPTVNVKVSDYGNTVETLDGPTAGVPANGIISVGIAPVAVYK